MPPTREIGGEFWDVPLADSRNGLFDANVQWYQSGRAALRAILQGRGWRTAALPSWCCESMIRPFVEAGMEVRFYQAMEPSPKNSADVALVMDYFGYSGTAAQSLPCGAVIRDLTHSLLSERRPADADFCFGSLRKWAGFWTGGYAWTADGGPLPAAERQGKALEYETLRAEAMAQKAEYLGRPVPPDTPKTHLETFARAEELLDLPSTSSGAPRDIESAWFLDVDLIRKARRMNADMLLGSLGDLAVFPEMEAADCPLFVPIRVPGRRAKELQRFMASRSIYCPIHWPVSGLHALSPAMLEFYESVLSLVCDQRYGEEEMNREIDAVNEFLKR